STFKRFDDEFSECSIIADLYRFNFWFFNFNHSTKPSFKTSKPRLDTCLTEIPQIGSWRFCTIVFLSYTLSLISGVRLLKKHCRLLAIITHYRQGDIFYTVNLYTTTLWSAPD